MQDKSKPANQIITSLAEAVTNQERAALLSGFGTWKTAAFPAYGNKTKAFLSVVNQRASDVAIAWDEMTAATSLPNGSAMGSSTGRNLRRTPLASRSYEYIAEINATMDEAEATL